MANQLKMAIIQSILQLHSAGWSQRRIATDLGVDRETVARYVRLSRESAQADQPDSNPAKAPIGGPGSDGSNPAKAPINAAGSGGSNPATAPGQAPIPGPGSAEADRRGSSPPVAAARDPARCHELAAALAKPTTPTAPLGARSDCGPWRETIEAKHAQGLSARRIHQDLVAEHGAQVSYDSVRRFLRTLGWQRPLPFRRMEVAPGEEAQVDFGTGAPIVTGQLTARGKPKYKKTHVFRIVMSHSRKAYSEATYRQTTDDFLTALENAFWHFGGVPKVLVIDNLKAAVKHPDWFDPELVPKVAAFAAHYGTVILPTKPYTPRHKGKVERGIDYVQENGLKGRTFETLAAQNEHLQQWEANVADTRIHGTTRQHVGRVFRQVEQAALLPLPEERFTRFQEAERKVNRDGHVEVAKAYYSAPPEYLGRTVWVRWDSRLVRIFNRRFEQVAVHVRREPGRFSTLGEHLAAEKIAGIERGTERLLAEASQIGPQTAAWSSAMLQARGIAGVRTLLGLVALSKRHAWNDLERACETAVSYGAFHLRSLRQLLKRHAPPQQSLPFLDEHPLIRPLTDYGQLVRTCLAQSSVDRRSQGDGFLRHGWTEECSTTPSLFAQKKRPDDSAENRQGVTEIPPPRSGYPLVGCSAAEPTSVSPDLSSVVPPSFPC